VPLQGLELLVTVLLARNRQPPPTVAAGVPHADLAAELLTLPSGLLAKVCEAIVKLKARLGPACVRGCVCTAMHDAAADSCENARVCVFVCGAGGGGGGGRGWRRKP
jgi:hypothetical protein